MSKVRAARTSAVAIVLATAVGACGGDSPQSAATSQPASVDSVASHSPSQPATGAVSKAVSSGKSASSPSAVTAGTGSGWAADVCGIVDQGALAKTIGTPISSAATSPGRNNVCEYAGTFPGGEVATVVRLQYLKDRSEWDIRAGNLGIKDESRLPNLGVDAFRSADGIWVLLADERMFIADVAYGISGESAKELAVTQQVLALSSPEGRAQADAAAPAVASATPPAAAPSPALAVDACSLITPAEAASAIGGKVGPAKPGAAGTSCSYNEEPFAFDGGLLSVTVFAETAISYQMLQGQFTNKEPLPGVGDEAFIANMPDTAGANAGFRVGPTVVLISFGAKGPTSAIPGKLQALAAAAAGRL